MPAFAATAPGKIILFGEHAVVYGRPALAAPVSQVQARAVVMPELRGPAGWVHIQAPDIGVDANLEDMSASDPLGQAVRNVLDALGVAHPPACTLRVTSTIPLAAGLGSGAAVSVAVIRALAAFLGRSLPPERVSSLAYDVEKLHHGTPSGIDNTVITFAMPVYFVRGQPLELLHLPAPFTVIIGDTGVKSPTAAAVGDLRRAWQAAPERYEPLFNRVGCIVQEARRLIELGQPEQVGPLMDENQVCLEQMGVSSLELERLVHAARQAGALGAKLSGGGRGGNMIALVRPEEAAVVAQALQAQGAVHTLITTVRAPENNVAFPVSMPG